MRFVVNQNKSTAIFDRVREIAALADAKFTGVPGAGFLYIRVPDEDANTQQAVQELLGADETQPTFIVGPDHAY